ncbi:MAG: hypothetical protein IJX90_12425 [Blautia sp.]|nr:hypothetical protein [Blautia sp.]
MTGKLIRRVLEWVHPVLLIPLLCPSFYLFFRERREELLLPLYLAGGVLVIFSAVSREAARRVYSLWTYLLLCGASAAETLGAAWVIGKTLFYPELRTAYLLEIIGGCLWMMISSAQLRMREKGRQKARRINDISWQENAVVLEKPHPAGLACFAVSYVMALLNASPVFCDTALGGFVVYLAIVLIYLELQVSRDYLDETKDLTHVPAGKIRTQRLLRFVGLFFAVLAAAVPAVLSRAFRTYRDLRYWDLGHVIRPEDIEMPDMTNEFLMHLSDWKGQHGEYHPAPAFFKYIGMLLVAVVVLLCLYLLYRVIARYFASFQGLPEENGDVAVSFEADEVIRLSAPRRRLFSGPLTEREKIRRNYRRTIRKYRKQAPLPKGTETPAEIEAGTTFPDGFDVRELHEAYEQARYGE